MGAPLLHGDLADEPNYEAAAVITARAAAPIATASTASRATALTALAAGDASAPSTSTVAAHVDHFLDELARIFRTPITTYEREQLGNALTRAVSAMTFSPGRATASEV